MSHIIHTADFHIGARFEFLPPDRASQAIRLQLQALQALAVQCAAMRTDALLIAGDLFDTPTVRPQIASAVFAILAQCPCPVFISPGNHDYFHAESPYAQKLPDNVHVFTGRTLEPYALSDGETVIWGAAFQDNRAAIPLLASLRHDQINICLVHGELGGSGGYNSISEADVQSSSFDYIALGHNHHPSGMVHIGVTAVACPGCFSATASNETALGGYLAGHIAKRDVALTAYPSGALEFRDIRVPLTGLRDDAALAESLLPLLPEEPKRTCCHVHLIGTRMYQPNIRALTQSLESVCFSVRVTDESTEQLDLFRYRHDDGLRGIVTRDFITRIDANKSDEQACAKLKLALEYAIAALDGREME